MKLELYGYWRSSSTWRVRIALAYKGLDATAHPVHLLREGGEQHSAAHQARNPMEQVPVLGADGELVSQSMAIIELIEELFPNPPLLPSAPLERARARQLAEIVNSGIQPVQNLKVLQRLQERHGFDKESARSWAAEWIADGFSALEVLATRHAGRYCLGDAITLADLFLVPQVYNARRFRVDLTPYPTLLRIESTAMEHPAFYSTRPEVQTDAEP